jgi:ABC-2 type transport system permease protein
MRLAPGSVPWLMRHELRLVLRTSAQFSWRAAGVLGAVLVGLAALGGAPLAAMVADRSLLSTPGAALAIDLTLAVLFSLMLSQTLSMTVQAFYERGDLDLLLSSPVPARRLLFVRCAGIALGAIGLYLFIATPLVAAVVVRGRWQLLALYPLLLSMGFAAAGVGLLLALVLFTTLGPRRTRTVGQVLAAFTGAAIVLGFQLPQLLPHGHALLAEWLSGALRRGWFAQGSALAWPLRAGLGAPGPLLGLALLAGALFIGAVEIAGTRFTALAAAAAGTHTRRARNRRPRPFRTGPQSVLIRKELRLIVRDPLLLSRLLLPVLYLIPAVLVSFSRGPFADVAASIGAALLTLIAGQIAGNLAWITISAEDAPDLLRCAPVTPALARRAKLLAAVIPLLPLAIPIGVLAWVHPGAAVAATVGVIASAFANAYIQLWYEKPMPRRAFRRRPPGAVLPSLGGLLVSLGWAVAAAIASRGTGSAFAIAIGVALLPALLQLLLWLGRNREQRAAYRRQLIDPPPTPP